MDPPRGVATSTTRLPRAGGDGPATGTARASLGMAPPRRRGWTPSATCASAPLGSPAQAGMDRAAGSPCRADAWARGEAPPRRRGWTPHPGPQRAARGGSPAQAGMAPPRRRGWTPRGRGWIARGWTESWELATARGWCSRRGGLPRAGGDGPPLLGTVPQRAGDALPAPPRRRGWTPPRSRTSARAWTWLPRAGGDGPDNAALRGGHAIARVAPPRRRRRVCLLIVGSPAQAGMDPSTDEGWSAPPRRRGWTQQHCREAGMDPRYRLAPPRAGMDRRLPRAGGDGPAQAWTAQRRDGRDGPPPALARLPRAGGDGPWSSRRPLPRAGGDGPLPRARVNSLGSPAQAGMDPSQLVTGARSRTVVAPPRRRGWTRDAFAVVGPSTRRRGWTAKPRRSRPGYDGSPAQAGMDPARALATDRSIQAPPRRRGWTLRVHFRVQRDGGSPAQAGMDPMPPRVRAARQMAPPRRRGWTRPPRAWPLPRGSPAQAGMDPAMPR
jgi:hypothetical protein